MVDSLCENVDIDTSQMDPMGYTRMNVEQETTEKQIKHHLFYIVGENCSGLFYNSRSVNSYHS